MVNISDAEGKKAVLIALIFLIFFVALPVSWFGQNPDYKYHFQKAAGLCSEMMDYQEVGCPRYPSLYHTIAGFFTDREIFFLWFNLFLFAVATPLLLFLICRKAIVVWFYFSATSYFYAIISGSYPQGLAIMLMLGLFASKNNLIRLGLLLASIIVHQLGFYLVLAAFILILLQENFTRGFLFCSPFWGSNPPAIILKAIADSSPQEPVRVNTILAFLSKLCPLPFLYWGLKGLAGRKEWALIGMFIITIAGAIYFNHARILLVAPLVVLPGLAWHYEKSKHKKWILGLSILWFLFELEQWIAMVMRIFC